MKSHKDLIVWQKSIEFVLNIYKITKLFPHEELYGITSQIRRASVSISSNIAEGAARKGKKEFIQFLYISLGSVSELETQIIIAHGLEYIDSETENLFQMELKAIRNMILGLIKQLNLKEDK